MPVTDVREQEGFACLGGVRGSRGKWGRCQECCRGWLPWDFTGVEGGVMVVADSEGDDVGGRRL